MSESGYHELFTGKMLPELKDIDKNQKSSFSILLYHYAVTGDIAEWISTDDGKCAYDILQGIRHGDMETGEEVGSASSDDPFVDLLRSFDISDDIIDTFKQKHKKGSYKYISEHPFEGLKYGIPVSVCDTIAYQNNIAADSNERINALTGYEISRNKDNGNTRVRTQKFVRKVSALSESSSYKTAVTPEQVISSALEDKSVRQINGFLTLDDDYKIEHDISVMLKKLDSNKKNYAFDTAILGTINKKLGIKMSHAQQNIVTNVLSRSGIHMITGGPGTGKSCLIHAIAAGYYSMHTTSAALCAQSGKAASNLGSNGVTIHSLLRLPAGDYTKAQLDKMTTAQVSAKLVVIDEFSMVDIKLFYMLLKSIAPDTTLVLCGDTEQLSSVGEGNIMQDMIRSGKFSLYRLTENFRQREKKTLAKNIAHIRKGEMPASCDSMHLIQTSTDDEAFEQIMRLTKESDIKTTQILCPAHNGSAGINNINDKVRALLGRDTSRQLSEGDKVIFTRNSTYYNNGETGTIISAADDHISVLPDGSSQPISIYPDSYDELVCGYACSIHKSQGSEYDRVIICLPETSANMLNRNLIYTAVTRARSEVFIVYTGLALDTALSRVLSRDTWLYDMLCTGVDNKAA